MLEPDEIAANDDQVHAPLVFDVEVADGVPRVVDNLKAQLLLGTAGEFVLVKNQAKATLGNRETAHWVDAFRCQLGAVVIGIAVALARFVGGTVVISAVRVDGLADSNRPAKDDGENRREGRDPAGTAHGRTL
jgi:hypothetical protein